MRLVKGCVKKMNNNKLQNLDSIKIINFLFLVASAILFVCAICKYKGEGITYFFFTIMSYLLLYSGFRKNALFFDTFVGIFFWLGFWLKLTVRVAFMESEFVIPVGNFDGFGTSFDQVLLVASCAFLGLLVASFIREKFLFSYPSKINDRTQHGLFVFYTRYRMYILIGFTLLFITVAVTNAHFGIYQRGTIPKTILPYGLSGVYKWLLLFGLASFSAVILKFEFTGTKKTSYPVAIIGLMECLFSSVSLLSRGMIINASALVYGVVVGVKRYEIKSNFRYLITCFIVFVVLFVSSVFIVNSLRAVNFTGIQATYSSGQTSELLEQATRSTTVLFLDRWVGIEGVMAVSSYPDKGWGLWRKGWQEKFSDNKISFFDMNIIDSPYKNTDTTKHHFISLPGVVAFCFYPGSFIFLFACMLVIGTFASLIEIVAFRLGGKNLILCALLAQVIVFRLCSFGYAPGQSYLLLGTIVVNILMIYFADKFLMLWFKRKGTLNF